MFSLGKVLSVLALAGLGAHATGTLNVTLGEGVEILYGGDYIKGPTGFKEFSQLPKTGTTWKEHTIYLHDEGVAPDKWSRKTRRWEIKRGIVSNNPGNEYAELHLIATDPYAEWPKHPDDTYIVGAGSIEKPRCVKEGGCGEEEITSIGNPIYTYTEDELNSILLDL
ncbi:hypothetical protein I317_02107 [Kwoniella heveanensis CBS 569]|nr:hypothetical protein I317_02107 [Kwoniella heveanensis CBS 569]